jgi:predicted metal-dependent hydrolase
LLKVKARRVFVQRMKTRWGRCTPASACIRLNTDLAKKPPECLEYIVVHERVHLLEPTHNERFAALLDLHLPRWQHLRKQLNRLPVRHEVGILTQERLGSRGARPPAGLSPRRP